MGPGLDFTVRIVVHPDGKTSVSARPAGDPTRPVLAATTNTSAEIMAFAGPLVFSLWAAAMERLHRGEG